LKFSLKKIAKRLGGNVIGNDSLTIEGINSLDAAVQGQISFFADRKFEGSLRKTKATAIIVSVETPLFKGPQVVVSNPELAYAKVASIFAPPVPRYPGVSEKAVLHDSACIGKDVSIYPSVYVGEEASIGDDVILFPGVFIGDRVRIGNGTVVYPNVTILQDCQIGHNVVIHAGTVIGSDGFGFVRDGAISVKIPQIGTVRIDDDVEIGANSCIDRAAFGKTWIKRGVKTDNFVHVAHNVVIGEDTIVVAQVGISGTVHIGNQVIIGGQVGISDHVEIGDRVMIGSQSGVPKSIPSGEVVSGTPAIPHRLWLKTSAIIKRLPKFKEHLRDLEKRVAEMEKKSSKE